MLTIRGIYPATAALLLAAVSGCVLPEVYEVSCTRDPKTGLWTVSQTLWNLGRDYESVFPSGDFDSLVTELTSGELDSSVVRVIEHVFWEEGDSLCARSAVVSTSLPEEFRFSEDSTSIEHTSVDSLGQIMVTNGTVTFTNEGKDDDVTIRWPADAKEIHLKWRWDPDVKPFSKEERARILEAHRANPIPKVKAAR